MKNVYCIDELIRVLLDMKENGYSYCGIEECEGNANEDFLPDSDHISFTGLEAGGCGGCLDFDNVCAVPEEEVFEYADRFIIPPSHRKPITIKSECDNENKKIFVVKIK